jgi:hypothetical protein
LGRCARRARPANATPPAPPAPAPASGAFYTLLEGARAATIARLPNRGSGYLSSLGVANGDDRLTWPPGSAAPLDAPFDVSNAQVFCNLGADWFSETRRVTGLDFGARTVRFEATRNGVAGCNGKAYLQGPRELIDEPGEFAHDPASGLLYYWPLDPASVLPGAAAPIVAAPAAAALQFFGAPGGPPAADIAIEGLELRGSRLHARRRVPHLPARPPQRTSPRPRTRAWLRIEGAARIALLRCKLLHVGLSAVWAAREARNVTVAGMLDRGRGLLRRGARGALPRRRPLRKRRPPRLSTAATP